MMTSPQEIEHWETFYRYWLAHHVGDRGPRRSDIDPMIDLPHMAPNLIVIELRPEKAEYRLVGTDVVSHFGVDRTGKAVGTSNVDSTQLIAWQGAVAATAHDGRPRMLVSHYPGAEKSKTIAVILPLAPDSDGVSKLFCAAFFGRPYPDTDAFPELAVENVVLDI